MATLLLRSRHSKKEARRPNAVSKPGVGDGRCKRHPKHRQSPGVCSLCLRERLAQLNNPPSSSSSRLASAVAEGSSGGSSSSSSISSYYSSSSASSCSSPPALRYYGHGGKVSMSSLLFGGKYNANNVLKKSRSLAFVPRSTRPARDHRDDDNHEKKKSSINSAGFWSKLLNVNHKRTEREGRVSLAMHSRTVRERSSVPERLGQ